MPLDTAGNGFSSGPASIRGCNAHPSHNAGWWELAFRKAVQPILTALAVWILVPAAISARRGCFGLLFGTVPRLKQRAMTAIQQHARLRAAVTTGTVTSTPVETGMGGTRRPATLCRLPPGCPSIQHSAFLPSCLEVPVRGAAPSMKPRCTADTHRLTQANTVTKIFAHDVPLNNALGGCPAPPRST